MADNKKRAANGFDGSVKTPFMIIKDPQRGRFTGKVFDIARSVLPRHRNENQRSRPDGSNDLLPDDHTGEIDSLNDEFHGGIKRL